MGVVPPRLRCSVQLINFPLRLDHAISRIGFDLGLINQAIGSPDEHSRGKSPYAGWYIARCVDDEDEIQHPVAEVEEELAEIFIIIDIRPDVAPGIVEDYKAIPEVLIDVFEGIILIAADFVATGDHLTDAPFKGHLLFVFDVDFLVGAPDLGHPIIRTHNRTAFDGLNDLLTEGTLTRSVAANDNGYLCVPLAHFFLASGLGDGGVGASLPFFFFCLAS